MASTYPVITSVSQLGQLTDVTLSTPLAGDVFYYNGTVWRDTDVTTADVLTLGSGGIRFGTGTNTMTIAPPSGVFPTFTLTLPEDDGAPSQVLTTDGAGVLSWTSPSGGTVTGVASVGGGAFDVQSGVTGTDIDIKTISASDNIIVDEDVVDRLTFTGSVTEGAGPTTATTPLVAGDVVYYDKATGLWEKASADAAGANTLATGYVVRVLDDVAGDYIIGHWGIFSVLPELVAGEGGGDPTTGDYLYASTATGPTEPGLVQATAPASGTYSNPVGQRVTATQFYFFPMRASLVP